MRNRMCAAKGRVGIIATGLLATAALLSPWANAQTTVSSTGEYRQLMTAVQSIRSLGTHPFGESVNLYNGSPSFEVTDVSVPSTGPVLQLSRSLDTANSGLHVNLDRPFGDRDPAIPRIATVTAFDTGNPDGWYVTGSAGAP